MFVELVAPVVRFSMMLAACMSLVSCYTVAPVPAAFWNNKDAKIAVVVFTEQNKGKFYYQTSAITEAPRHPAAGALAGVDAGTFRAYKGKFASELRKKGFKNVVELKGDLKWRDYPRVSARDLGPGGRDYGNLLASHNADYLIMLGLYEYGVGQRALAGVGIAAPWGRATAGGVMVRKEGGVPVWATGPLSGMQSTEIADGWDQPGRYPILVKAAREVQDVSGEYLIHEFFGYPE